MRAISLGAGKPKEAVDTGIWLVPRSVVGALFGVSVPERAASSFIVEEKPLGARRFERAYGAK